MANPQNIKINLHMPELDRQMFRRYLDNATCYFEYGSGGSTLEAAKRHNICKIYSVENDPEWHSHIKTIVSPFLKTDYVTDGCDTSSNTSSDTSSRITLYHAKMPVKYRKWGYPTDAASTDEMSRYSDYLPALGKEEAKKIDLVLIDGRFRVACALKAFDYLRKDAYIAFDDYYPRRKYHVIQHFYKIVDNSPKRRMAILQKRLDAQSPSHELIDRYSVINK